MTSDDLGPVYTRGSSYRARAEARQRDYRANVLRKAHGRYGHMLATEAAEAGSNFLLDEIVQAALTRQHAGKGVAPRTFENMLSSQAMCFNVFAPLRARLPLAAKVLQPFIPGLLEVTAIDIEHTPAGEIFGDQSGRGGVDCDVLVEGRTSTARFVQVIETKFVEPDFSVCGFRKAGRERNGLDVCPTDVAVRDDRTNCLYQRNKGYGYWRRSDEHRVLDDDALPARGCPFGDGRWQLWVNLTLAHAEAASRGATEVGFAVCSSSRNTTLLREGRVLEEFRAVVRRPEQVRLFDLEELLARVGEVAPAQLVPWAAGLRQRYADI